MEGTVTTSAPASSTAPEQGGAPATVNAVSNTPEPKPTPKPEEYFEHKVNGQVRKYTREQLLAKASLADAATERFESASQREKKYNAWRESVKANPIKALMDPELGLTKEQIRAQIEQYYKQEYIDPETLTPEQQRIAELERKIAEKEAREKEFEEMTNKQKEEAEAQQTAQEMQQTIISILEKSGLEKTRFNASRIAYWMRQNLKNGYDAPEEVILNQVKEERQAIIKTMIETMEPAQLVASLGDEFVRKVRMFDMERLNAKLNPGSTIPAREADDAPPKPGKERTMSDVDKYLNRARFGR